MYLTIENKQHKSRMFSVSTAMCLFGASFALQFPHSNFNGSEHSEFSVAAKNDVIESKVLAFWYSTRHNYASPTWQRSIFFLFNSDQCEAFCIVCGDAIVTRTQHKMQRIQTIRCGHMLRARAIQMIYFSVFASMQRIAESIF